MQKNNHILGIFSALAILVAFSVSFSAHAQTTYQYTPLVTVPIGQSGQNLTTAGTPVDPATYVQNLYVFAFSIGIVIAVVSGVWSGVEWMLGGDSPSKIGEAKKRLQGVGWGLALLLSSYIILRLINPDLVNFNFNLGTINVGNLQSDLQSQQNSLTTLANNAVAQSQSDQQKLANAEAILVDAQTDPSATPAEIQAAQAAVTAAQTVADQSAEKATVSQSTSFVFNDSSSITKDINSSDVGSAQTDLQKLQSDFQTAQSKLQQEQSAASNAGNTTLVNQIAQDAKNLDNSIVQQYGCHASQLQVSTQQTGGSDGVSAPVITASITCIGGN